MSNFKEIQITIPECLSLIDELGGVKSQDGKVQLLKGIFHQPITMSDKFDLKIMFNKVFDLTKTYHEVRSEFIKQNGIEHEDGSFEIPKTIKEGESETEVENPKYVEFAKMHESLVTQKHTLKLKPLSPESFNFKAEEVYPVFMEILERMQK